MVLILFGSGHYDYIYGNALESVPLQTLEVLIVEKFGRMERSWDRERYSCYFGGSSWGWDMTLIRIKLKILIYIIFI